jgi:hypothetical protein
MSKLSAAVGVAAVWVAMTTLSLEAAVPARSAPPAPPPPADTGAAPVALQGNACDFAFDPQNVALAGIDPEANTVTLYPKAYLEGTSTTAVGPVKVGELPNSIIYKRYKDKAYFVVGCRGESKLYVLDAKTFEVVKVIALGAKDSASLCTATDPNNPYLYYAGGSEQDLKAGCVDLSTFRDEGSISLPGSGYRVISELAVSANGRRLYACDQNKPMSLQVYVQEKEGDAKAWRLVRSGRIEASTYRPDPFDIYTAWGSSLYSADLSHKAVTFSFAPVCFFPDRPVIIGIAPDSGSDILTRSGYRLFAVSYNTLKVFGTLALPADTGPKKPAAPTSPPAPPTFRASFERTFPAASSTPPNLTPRLRGIRFVTRVFADTAGNRVVVASGNRSLLVPLKDLKVTEEPMLLASVDVPSEAFVGEPLQIPVKPVSAQTTVELKDGPVGMKLVKGVLTWTPGLENLGRTFFALKFSAQGTDRTQTFSLDTTRRFIALGFVPSRIAVSPSGRYVVAWSPRARDLIEGPVSVSRESPDQARVAVVDLTKGKVVADKRPLYQINALAVDDQGVYVAPARSLALDHLKLEDLSTVRRITAPQSITQLTPISPKLLAVSTDTGVVLYSLPDLKPAGAEMPVATALATLAMTLPSYRQTTVPDGEPGPCSISRVAEGWFVGGWVLAPDLSKARREAQGLGLPALTDHLPPLPASRLTPPAPWGRVINSEATLTTTFGQPLARLQVGNLARWQWTILDVYPVAATLNSGKSSDLTLVYNPRAGMDLPGRTIDAFTLTLSELTAGKRIDQIPLTAGRRSETVTDDDLVGLTACLVPVGNKIVAIVRDRLMVLSLDAELLKKCAPPLEFVPPADILTVSLNEPTPIAHKLRGGTGPYTFSLIGERPGISIEPNTGVVTVNGPALVKPAANVIAQYNGWAVEPGSRSRGPVTETSLPLLASQVKQRFQQFTGRKPAGIPVSIPLNVTVIDKDHQEASIRYDVILEVPEEAVVKELRNREAGSSAAEPRPTAPRVTRPPASSTATPPTVDARQYEELVKRIEALEAKVDLLVKLLQKSEPAPPGGK